MDSISAHSESIIFEEGLSADFIQQVQQCNRCPRLRSYCEQVAQTKKKSTSDQQYWGKPVAGFGKVDAKILVVGLAPGAHGANRTGRVITGDRSGEWLYRALFRAGLSSQMQSTGRGDGLVLHDTYVTCVAKCAPPQNKPLPSELRDCASYFDEELRALSRVQVIVTLGQIAYESLWRAMKLGSPRPKFAHGVELNLDLGKTILLSYHPSQQNTFTGKLTEKMLDQVFLRAVEITKDSTENQK